MMRVEERRCAGVYTAIAEGGGYGGNVRYFDLNRTLIAVTVRSDTNQFCNGSSFEIVYGTKPACPTAEVVTSLCRS